MFPAVTGPFPKAARSPCSSGISRWHRGGGPRNRTWRCGFGDRILLRQPNDIAGSADQRGPTGVRRACAGRGEGARRRPSIRGLSAISIPEPSKNPCKWARRRWHYSSAKVTVLQGVCIPQTRAFRARGHRFAGAPGERRAGYGPAPETPPDESNLTSRFRRAQTAGGPWRTVGPRVGPNTPRDASRSSSAASEPGSAMRYTTSQSTADTIEGLVGCMARGGSSPLRRMGKPRTWRGFLRSSGRIAVRRRWTWTTRGTTRRTPCRIHRRDEQPHEPQRHRGLPPGDSVSHTTAATTVFGALTGSAHRRDDARADRTVERPAPTARAASPPRSGRRSGRARSPGPRPVRSRAARPRGGRRRGCRRGTRRR